MEILKAIKIGFLEIHVYGLIIALAIVIGWYIAKKRAHLYKIPTSIFDSLWILAPLGLGVAGGRIYHVIDKWSIYQKDPISILNLAGGGLGIWGAIAGIILGFFLVAKVHKVQLLKLLDLASPSIVLGQAIGRIGNFINQEGFGPPTNLPWAVQINGIRVHPTFFYEAILNLFAFFIILKLSRKLKKPGQAFGLYLILYALSRLVTEFFRIDTWTISGLKISYLFSFVAICLGMYLLKPRLDRT